MSKTFKALSLLLSYPSIDLQAAIPAIRRTLATERVVPEPARRALEPLLGELQRDDIYDLEERYVSLFDRSRALSLHLFEHVHGENKERGQAMVDLGQLYESRGYDMTATELPDYLPLFLEFLSLLPIGEAIQLLNEPVHVFAALQERLVKRETPYAAVLAALVATAQAKPDAQVLAELRQAPDPDPDDPKALDADYEEAPITFSEPQPPTGLIAKIRAARRPVAKAAAR